MNIALPRAVKVFREPGHKREIVAAPIEGKIKHCLAPATFGAFDDLAIDADQLVAREFGKQRCERGTLWMRR